VITSGLRPAPTVLLGQAPDFVRRALAGRTETPEILGTFPAALYLRLASGEVIAVLSSEAVALPIGIVIEDWRAALPLPRDPAEVAIVDGVLHVAELRIYPELPRSTRMPFVGEPDTPGVQRCRDWLGGRLHHLCLDASLPGTLRDAGTPDQLRLAVSGLIGRGPGLTPAGDDLLCGLLASAHLFGRDCTDFASAVATELANRPRATTALSRQLLLRACAGDGLPQLRELAAVLVKPADPAVVHKRLSLLTAIGHTSGLALLAGLLASVDLPPSRRVSQNGTRT
jgi:hypothetical protein